MWPVTELPTMAIVGLAVGAGYYLVGVITTALMLLVLGLLNVIENRFVRTSVSRYISLQADYRKGVVKEIRLLVNEFSDTLLSFTIQKHLKNKRIRIQIVARIHRDQVPVHVCEPRGIDRPPHRAHPHPGRVGFVAVRG